MASTISIDGIDQLVGNITVGACIAFIDEEILLEGRDSIKTLHITIKCKSHVIPRALLHNGSSLNMMLMSTLSKLSIDLSDMKRSDGGPSFQWDRKEVLKNIKLPIQVGPCTSDSEFIVMDINPSYNYLLGRPWIHMPSIMPSTLHQKVKFVVEESLIIVVVKEDMITTTTVTTPYHEVKEDASECSFRSFEVATTTNIKDELKTLMSHLS